MNRFSLRLAMPFAFLLALAWAVPSRAISKEFNQSYPLQSGGTFELQNVNGTVEVQGWDREEVEIHAVKTAKQKESDLERVFIDVNAKPDSISVDTRYPQDEGVEVVVEYTVHVPHGAHIEHLGTVNGTLRISGVGDLGDLHSVNGSIEVYEGGGAVHAHTTNGNLHIELAHTGERNGVSAETTNGSVLLAIPSDTQADLEARSMNGTFFSELPLSMQSTQRPREVHGILGRGGAPIKLRTVNGGIRVIILRSTI